MKRVIAISDSHGMLSSLQRAAQLAASKGKIDVFVFLGDGMGDFEAIKPDLLLHNPEMQVIAVRGNNDFSSGAPLLDEFAVNGRVFIAAHGHAYHVKLSLNRLAYAARERNAAVALYGHTHAPRMEEVNGLWLINPGAACNASWRGFAYAEIQVSENGALLPDLIRWPK